MCAAKQVKVDNWGIYFLQRLKHFFNRTDYCDLTLQFQDNAQLKVHRLVLSACTEYFELLERTCEMYEDCLVMPDDLQADVVVPIVNFMYTGQLEFKMDLLERLYQTSEIMNMPVLTRLLESHRNQVPKATHSYSAKRLPAKCNDSIKTTKPAVTTMPSSNKRSYCKAFDDVVYRDKRVYLPLNKPKTNGNYRPPSPIPLDPQLSAKKLVLGEPRPTRYELPEELDTDNIFDNSFSNISYTSKPLMVHPETTKQYSSKHSRLFSEPSSSKKFRRTPTVDIVECKKIAKDDNIFEDNISDRYIDDTEMYPTPFLNVKSESPKDPNQLFDQMLDHTDSPKVTIEAKDKAASNLDHAKIISEVLKKYPHLVKSNKNIKLKIVNTPNKSRKQRAPAYTEAKTIKLKTEDEPDFTYESDVIDSKEAAKLIAMGADNIKGPWICLICGTPGKALHFTSYYKYRRHLVDIHHEKPVANMCEYCGQKSLKRNYLLHHLYSKHGVEPPPQYNFPKCNQCNYIALTEAYLVKHKMTHSECKNFRCNVCPASFHSSNQLLLHIQTTGHKYSADKKSNLQCIYCMRVFLREGNLYAHLKTAHKKEAKSDGIIDDSDEERPKEEKPRIKIDSIDNLKVENPQSFDNEYEDIDIQYQIQQKSDGNIHVVTKKQHNVITNPRQTILNAGFVKPKPAPKTKVIKNTSSVQNNFLHDTSISPSSNNQDEEIVMIDNNEYIMKDHQLIPKKSKQGLNEEFIISDIMDTESGPSLQAVTPTTSMAYSNIYNPHVEENVQQPSMIVKKSSNLNQQIQFFVSNDEEYKALMSSNQPIIFDNNDSSKTLTVLTAPHSSSMDTTAIDLDNTQSNDMMIIRDDYPLNVNETVVTENSNIVVVYSHPVDDQNKQYQILTTQGLGTQFVQSSAIITQNYETVTTSTPVMSAHVLDTQVQDTWQANVHQNIGNEAVQITSTAELQVIAHAERTEVTPVEHETSSNINDLPEVQLITGNAQDTPTSGIVEPVNQSVNMSAEDVVQSKEQEIAVELPNTASTPMDVNASSEAMIETETSNVKLVEHITKNVIEPQETINKENAIVIPEQTEPSCVTEQILHNIEEAELPNDTHDRTLSSDIAESDQSNIVEEPVGAHEPSEVAEIVPEKIQNLTSEWSEDEYESTAQDPTDTNENIPRDNSQNETPQVAEASPEIEESIENIQQEVDKQMTSALPPQVEVETGESTNLTLEVNLPNLQRRPQTSGATTGIAEVSQEKISSLLNDWEDNDSQEENSSKNDNENAPTTSDGIEHTPVGTSDPNPEKEDHNKDKIKSLVSDWDDEEEDNKV